MCSGYARPEEGGRGATGVRAAGRTVLKAQMVGVTRVLSTQGTERRGAQRAHACTELGRSD